MRAVTRAGQVKRSGNRHEKDDRRAIDDRTRWVLGFDNEQKLDDLRRQESQCRARLLDIDRILADIDDETRNQNARETAARDIGALEWKDIDVAAADAAVTALETRINAWQQENPEHAALTRALELADKEESEARVAEGDARAALAGNSDRIKDREHQIAQIETSATAVPDDVRRRIHDRFRDATRNVTADNIDGLLNRIRKDITTSARQTSTANQKTDTAITAILTAYLGEWSHARSDLRGEPEYVGDALDVLARLRRDGLPQFEAKFFDLLNEQSTRNLAELSRLINKAPNDIRIRIDPVNDSLHRSPFDVGRILQIKVRERRPQSATEFLADLKSITSHSLVEDNRAAAEQRYEKMAALLTRLGSGEPADRSWQRQVLDTRLHVGFIGVEVDDDGVDVNYHDSSAGLSGGQAQKLVFFCLAAALRYQLAGDGADIPTYGSIVLDEAFDKADPQYTRRALDVFQQFGFHMILATPLKLLSTLEEYIGGVATVTIKDGKASHVGVIPIQTARSRRETADA